jgi:hypothetical protein
MADDHESPAARPPAEGAAPAGSAVSTRRRSRPGGKATAAIVLVVGGVLAMVVPGLLRDGVCGLITCADVTPQVAVGRPTGTDLAVVVPRAAASQLRSLRLYQVSNEPQTAAGDWIISRTGLGAPTTIPFGSEPRGFTTNTPLATQPTDGTWVMEASFGCSATVVRFFPDQIPPGTVTTGESPSRVEPVKVDAFLSSATTTLKCATAAPPWQRWLFLLGALSACVGAVLGIVVVLRRPPSDDPDWYGP